MRLLIRADAGFCKPLLLNWCDRNRVDYIIGMGRNSTLSAHAACLIGLAEVQYQIHEKPQKLFDDFDCRAGSWTQPRRMIVKAEHNERGANTRYVVTSLKGTPKSLFRIF